MTAAAASSRCAKKAIAGVGTTPTGTERGTFEPEPVQQRGFDPRSRLARVATDHEATGAQDPRRGATERGDEFIGEIGFRVAADTVGPEPQHGEAGTTASSTAAPCGPS